jgi:hypothetical protein
MSDQLKAFIQQHKSEFDDKRPDPKLFDKIISEMDTNSKNNSKKIIFLPIYKKMIAAASIALILCSAIFFYLTKDQNKPDRNEAVVQQLPNLNPEAIEVKSNTQIPSTIQEKQLPVIEPKASYKTHKNNQISQPIVAELNNSKIIYPDQTPTPFQETTPIIDIETVVLNPTINNNTAVQNHNNVAVTQMETEIRIPTQEIAVVDHTVIPESSKNSSNNFIADATNSNSSNPSIRQYLRAKFYNLVSRKASKWTNKALQINTSETEDETTLAIQFKSDKVNFNKSITVPILGQ